jgi:bifunctional N-acetylglucosamine-1-phosphate-uridyltransferase/glucosamine-1-phosphate-acetyltransferase GlmU-like protein
VNFGHVKALLMAGGLGTRLRPLTERTPKCLVPIAGRPLLDYWIDALEVAGIRRALINTHHLAEQVREHILRVNRGGSVQIEESHEPALLGSAGTVHANRNFVKSGETCLIVYTDNCSTVDLSSMLRFHGSHSDPVTTRWCCFEPHIPSAAALQHLTTQHALCASRRSPSGRTATLPMAACMRWMLKRITKWRT